MPLPLTTCETVDPKILGLPQLLGEGKAEILVPTRRGSCPLERGFRPSEDLPDHLTGPRQYGDSGEQGHTWVVEL